MTDRIILVGFMCSGKSTIGRLLADRLGWDFIDFDEVIEREQGRKISDIFDEDGEAFFRDLEASLTTEVDGRCEVVLAPGGGWVIQPGLVERLRQGGLMVWLRVQPETVYSRDQRQTELDRPLLKAGEPLDAIRRILSERTPLYRRADIVVDTDGRRPEDIAEQIARLAWVR